MVALYWACGGFFVTGKNLDKKAGIESIEDETAQAESDAEEIRKPEMSFHCCRLTLLSLSLAMVSFLLQM